MSEMTLEKNELPLPIYKSFFRYNISAGTATACDYLMLIFCTEILQVYYVVSGFFGALTGASVAFFLGRNWTFLNKDGSMSAQSVKFLFVMGGSILLNTYGLFFFTDVIGVGHYTFAKLITAILVGVGYNFPMQRYFVFK